MSIVRPWSCVLFSDSAAADAADSSAIATKANPFGLPARSLAIRTDTSSPNGENTARRSASVVS
jgi:hypothetical protein